MKVTFDRDSVAAYEFTHGRKPRGHGQWIFGLGRSGAWTEERFEGTFASTRRQALRLARELGCSDVVLRS